MNPASTLYARRLLLIAPFRTSYAFETGIGVVDKIKLAYTTGFCWCSGKYINYYSITDSEVASTPDETYEYESIHTMFSEIKRLNGFLIEAF